MGYYIPDDMWEAIEGQSKTVQDAVVGAVVRLYFTGEEDGSLKGVSRALFVAFRERVVLSRKRSDARLGKTRTNGNQNRNKTAIKTGTNGASKPDFAIKGGDGGGEDLPSGKSTPVAPTEPFAEIVGYLNEKANRAYKPTSEATRELIRARLAEGFTVDDFKRVIDNKCASWLGDPKMDEYLRPSTLFQRSKFESYLNERRVKPKTLKEVADEKYAEFNR